MWSPSRSPHRWPAGDRPAGRQSNAGSDMARCSQADRPRLQGSRECKARNPALPQGLTLPPLPQAARPFRVRRLAYFIRYLVYARRAMRPRPIRAKRVASSLRVLVGRGSSPCNKLRCEREQHAGSDNQNRSCELKPDRLTHTGACTPNGAKNEPSGAHGREPQGALARRGLFARFLRTPICTAFTLSTGDGAATGRFRSPPRSARDRRADYSS